jgi:DNA-directed RNA polymerase specialized sigma24 family protein
MLGKPNSDIIIQKYYFGRNSFEIAKILKMNPVTVRSCLRRSMKKLKKFLSDMDITT